MKQEQVVTKRYQEDLVLFYDKYLNLENGFGEKYLEELMEKYVQVWENKTPTIDCTSTKPILEVDDQAFTDLDRGFLNFYYTALIPVNEDYDIIINSEGKILSFEFKKDLDLTEQRQLREHLNTNILSFLKLMPNSFEYIEALKAAQNIILQNVFVSKFHKALLMHINNQLGLFSAVLFTNTHAKILRYDDLLQNSLDYEKTFGSILPTRSLR